MAGKLAPGSLLTTDDQIRLYAEVVGEEKAAEQVRLARLEARKCVCEPQKLKRRWNGEHSPATVRSVHAVGCPKRKAWMEDV